MQLLLIRHADAGEHDPSLWPDDTLRPLTDKGRKRHRRVAKQLRKRGLVPTLLLASPWLRAWQTAVITTEFARGPAPLASPALAEAPHLGRLASAIGTAGDDAVVALVGHEPWLGHLASLLLAGDPTGLAIDFPKSGVLGLDLAELKAGASHLRFFWRPKGG